MVVETQDLASLPPPMSESNHGGSFADFSWQSRYHDRIIRDYDEFRRIVYYIQTNLKIGIMIDFIVCEIIVSQPMNQSNKKNCVNLSLSFRLDFIKKLCGDGHYLFSFFP